MIEPTIEITDGPIDRDSYAGSDYAAAKSVADAASIGAIVEFAGIVRGTEEGRSIAGIDYEAFRDMALAELRRIAYEIIDRFELAECLCIHRVGFVPAGEAAVYIRTDAKRRREAFKANEEFIAQLKQRVPIWKHPRERPRFTGRV